MANGVAHNTIVQETLKKKGVVLLPLKIYEQMKKRLAQLEKETRILQIVAEGEREYKQGKLKPVRSLDTLA